MERFSLREYLKKSQSYSFPWLKGCDMERRLVCRWLLNVGVSVLSLLLVIMLFELVLSFIIPPSFVHWIPHDELVTDHISGKQVKHMTSEFDLNYIINSEGNRGTLAGDSASEQIVLVGDSFTFGYGVQEEDSFGYLLEGMSELPVINLGQAGTEPEQIYKRFMLKLENLSLKPVVVVYTVYFDDLGNVGRWNLLEYDYELKSVEWKAFEKPPLFGLRAWLSRNSEIYNLVSRVLTQSKVADVRQADSILPEILNARVDGEFAGKVEKMDVILHLMKEAAESQSSELLLVYAPAMHEVNGEALSRAMEMYAVSEEQLGVRIIRETLSELAMENDVQYLDLTEPLREGNEDSVLYWEIDIHWTPEGNKVAAAEIYKVIEPMLG